MQKSSFSATIAIDTARNVFHFYSMIDGDKTTISHYIKGYTGSQLDDNLFLKFKDAVREFAQKVPSDTVQKVTVVLPDNAVTIDTVRIPTIKGSSQTNRALDTVLRGLFKNYDDLHVIANIEEQNKQYTTFSIAAVQKQIVSSIYAACSENKLLVDTLTFASSASIGTAMMLHPKLKTASFLFLDIKDAHSRFVFVAKGSIVGYYHLPFGLEFLRRPTVTREEMLFDHSYAELVVLNAKERAKSKKLAEEALKEGNEEAVIGSEEEESDVSLESDESNDEENSSISLGLNQNVFVKKTPRKLPKLIQREISKTEEGIAYENFRIFVKWALTLINGNERLVELGEPEFVCVNLPKDLAHLIDKVNEEEQENGISFIRLPTVGEKLAVVSNLELYGGLFPKQISSSGKF